MRRSKLNIRSSYAPNRLWKALLPEAYARLAPIIKHNIDYDIHYDQEKSQQIEKIDLSQDKEYKWKQ